MVSEKNGNERHNLIIKTIVLVMLLLLSFLATIIYVFAYPKTVISLYYGERLIKSYEVKRNTTLGEIPGYQQPGYTFSEWTYDESGKMVADPDMILNEEEIRLYAQYTVNQYTITYHVQVWDPISETYTYVENKDGFETRIIDYNTTFTLPTGRFTSGIFAGQLMPDFRDRNGYTFKGWSTTALGDDVSGQSIFAPGSNMTLTPAGNKDFYAYFEKNTYGLSLHNGIQYFKTYDANNRDNNIALNPLTDLSAKPAMLNGEFIVRNSDDVTPIPSKIQYLQNISEVVSKVTPKLINSAQDEGKGYEEYVFDGWYLDYDLTMPVSKYDMVLKVGSDKVPYLEITEDGRVIRVDAVLVSDRGTPSYPDDDQYDFNLYSKWHRKSYKVNFAKNDNGSNGYIESISVFKYDDYYGKYYLTITADRFDESSRTSTQKFYELDLANPYITSSAFMESNRRYRFTGWNTRPNPDSTSDGVWYMAWTQSISNNPDNFKVTLTKTGDTTWSGVGVYEYVDTIYRHTVSSDVTLYAQWKQLRELKLTDGVRSKNVVSINAIAGEKVTLPTSSEVADILGWSKEYYYFGGWTTNVLLSTATIIEGGTIYREALGGMPKDNVTLYVAWQKNSYTITFHMNGGEGEDKVYNGLTGGKTLTVPTATREGYLFNGWTVTKYPDNTKESEITDTLYHPTSVNYRSVPVNGVIEEYYASWTKRFAIEYDANGGYGNTAKVSKYGDNPTSRDLTLTITTASGSSLSRTGYKFKGWAILKSDGTLDADNLILPSKTIVFDFSNSTYRYSNETEDESRAIVLENDNSDTVKLYAYWEANKFTISLVNTVNNTITVAESTYGSDFDFSSYAPVVIGYKFLGWGNEIGDTIIYEPDGVMDKSNVTKSYVFYGKFTRKIINIEYKVLDKFGGETNIYSNRLDAGSDVSFGEVYYNTKFKAPTNTPSSTLYGDSSYLFEYWYYVDKTDSENPVEVIFKTDDLIQYYEDEEGGKSVLTVWAKFVRQTYDVNFNIVSPLDGSTITTISITVDKNQTIQNMQSETMSYYGYVLSQIREAMNDIDIKGYYLDRFVYTQGDKSVTLENSSSIIFNDTVFPNLKLSSGSGVKNATIEFNSIWEASDVEIIYLKDMAGTETKTDIYSGIKYNSTDTITTLSHAESGFIYEEGLEVGQWIIKNSENTISFAVGSNLIGIGSAYRSILDLSEFIEWTSVENSTYGARYKGTINLISETQIIYTINYYRYDGVNVVCIPEATQRLVYDEYNKSFTLRNGSIAVMADDLIFNGWRLGSMAGELMTENTEFVIDPETLSTKTLDFYADMSFAVEYQGIEARADGENKVIQIINYYSDGSYFSTANITELPGFTIVESESNFTDLFALYKGVYYKATYSDGKYILDTPITIEYTKATHIISVVAAKTISISYTIDPSDDQTYSDNTTTPVVEYYYIGANYEMIETARVAITAKKKSCTFLGWRMESTGTLYNLNDVVVTTRDEILIAEFSLPELGSVDVKIVYMSEDFDTDAITSRAEFDSTNGATITLMTGTDLGSGFIKAHYKIAQWKFGENIYGVGDSFNVPNIAEVGEEFIFVAIWIPIYNITFDGEISSAIDVPSAQVISGKESLNIPIAKPSIAGSLDTKFKYWELGFYKSDEFGNTHFESLDSTITIYPGDSVGFDSTASANHGLDKSQYVFVPKANLFDYVLIARWEKQSFSVNIHLTNPIDNVTFDSFVISVDFGTKLDSSAILNGYVSSSLNPEEYNTLKTSQVYNGQKIFGWATSSSDAISGTNVKSKIEINQDVDLYSAWSHSYVMTLDESGNTNTIYNPLPSDIYYYAGEDIKFTSAFAKTIYAKNGTMVYYDRAKSAYVTLPAVTIDDVEYNGNTNSDNYYMVTGFRVVSTSGTQTYNLDEPFTAPNGDATYYAVVSTLHLVTFYQNGLDSEATYSSLDTYIVEGETLALSSYTVTRNNYTLVGWNTDSNATVGLVDIVVNANTKLYAIWESNLRANFRVGDAIIFTLGIDNKGRLNSTAIENAISSNTAGLNKISLSGNDNTYSFGGLNYYFAGYKYGETIYTAEQLADIDIISNIDVIINLLDVYTIKYTSGVEGVDYLAYDYFVANGTTNKYGKITSTGIENNVVLRDNPFITYDNHEAIGWTYDTNYSGLDTSWYFAGDMTLGRLILDDIANKRECEMSLIWDGKSYSLNLMYVKEDAEGKVNPYNVYSAMNSDGSGLDESKWVNATSSGYRYDGSTFTLIQSVAGVPVVKFGQSLVLTAPKDAEGNDLDSSPYRLVGWSKTLYKLGFVPEKYYKVGVANTESLYDGTLYNVEDMVEGLTGDEITLYAVYELVDGKSVTLKVTNGTAKYSIATVETLTGYVYGNTFTKEETSFDTDTTITLSFINKLFVSAISATTGFEFSYISVDGHVINNSTAEISFEDIVNLSCVSVVFESISISAIVNLEYDHELKSVLGEDLSTVAFGDIVLSSSMRTDHFDFALIDTVRYSANISDYYTIKAFSSDGENTIDVIFINGIMDTSRLLYNALKQTTITFKLTSITRTIYFEANDSAIDSVAIVGNLNYVGFESAPNISVGEDNKIKVANTTTIVLPSVTRTGYTFKGWNYMGTAYAVGSEVTIYKDMTFSAVFEQNEFNINYILPTKTISTKFVGGDSVKIGYIGADAIDASRNGFTFVGWIDRDSHIQYTSGQEVTLEKRTYNFEPEYIGRDVNIIYVDSFNTDKTITMEFGKNISVPSETIVTSWGWAIPTNQYLYGWSVNGHTLLGGQMYSFDLLAVDYPDSGEIVVNAIYYDKYTYIIDYVIPNTLSVQDDATLDETFVLLAIDADGGIGEAKYTISSVRILDNTPYYFGGYKVKVNGAYLADSESIDKIYRPASSFSLEKPSEGYSLTYEIEAIVTNSITTANFQVVITSPLDSGVTLDNETFGFSKQSISTYYPLESSDLPINNGKTWTHGEISTEIEAEYTGYYLAGYTISPVQNGQDFISVTGENVVLELNNTESEYTLTTVWARQYVVNYFNKLGQHIRTDYVNPNTSYTISGELEDVVGYRLLGFAHSNAILPEGWNNVLQLANNTISYFTEDVVLSKVESNYNLYPLYSKEYTVSFDIQSDVINGFGGNDNCIQYSLDGINYQPLLLDNVQTITTLTTLYRDPSNSSASSTGKITDLIKLKYEDIISPFSFAGFSLVSGVTKEMVEDSKMIEDYELNPRDADNTYNITLYVVWERAIEKVNFVSFGRDHAGNEVTSFSEIVDFRYGDVLDFSRDEAGTYRYPAVNLIVEKISVVAPFLRLKFFEVENSEVTSLTLHSDMNVTMVFEGVYKISFVDEKNPTTTYPVISGTESELLALSPIRLANYPLPIDIGNTKATKWFILGDSSLSDFFGEAGQHKLTMFDLNFADNDYVLRLRMAWSVRNYTVNLHYFKTADSMLEGNYDGVVSVDTFRKDDTLYVINGEEVSTRFDDVLRLEGIDGLTGLATMFANESGKNHAMSTSVYAKFVAEANKVVLFDYVVGSNMATSESDLFTSDIYVIYLADTISVGVSTFVVDGEDSWYDYLPLDAIIDGKSETDSSNVDATFETTAEFGIQSIEGYVFKRYEIVKVDPEADDLSTYCTYSMSADNRLFKISKVHKDFAEAYDIRAVFTPKYVELTFSIDVASGNILPNIEINYTPLDWDKLIADGYVKVGSYNKTLAKNYSKTPTARGYDIKISVLYNSIISISDVEESDFAYMLTQATINNILHTADDRDFPTLNTLNKKDFNNATAGMKETENGYFVTISLVYKVRNQVLYIDASSEYYIGGASVSKVTISNSGNLHNITDISDSSYTLGRDENLRMFRQSVEIPYGSLLYATGITLERLFGLEIDHFEVAVYDPNQGWVFRVIDPSQPLDTTGDIAISVIFRTVEISVNFVKGDTNLNLTIENYVDSDSSNSITLGDRITLPKVYIYDGRNIFYTWEDGEAGEEIVLDDTIRFDKNGIYTIALADDSLDIHFVIYDNSNDVEIGMSSEYPTTVGNIAFAVTSDFVGTTLKNGYSILNVVDNTEISLSQDIELSNILTLPTGTITLGVGGGQFAGWRTVTGRATYFDGDTYRFSEEDSKIVTISDKMYNVISLNPIRKNTYSVTFVIMDPNGNIIDVNGQRADTLKYNMSNYRVEVVSTSKFSSFVLPTIESLKDSTKVIQWGLYDLVGLDSYTNFYTPFSSIDFGRYSFHGWTTSVSDTYNGYKNTYKDIVSAYSTLDANSVLYYNFVNGQKSESFDAGISKLNTLINEGKGYTTFYPVWEEKKSFTFVSTMSNDGKDLNEVRYYGMGEIVPLRDNSILTFNQASKKWIGWELTTGFSSVSGNKPVGGTTYAYIFSSAKYFGTVPVSQVHYKVTAYVAGKDDVYLVPTWSVGTEVVLDVNFGESEDLFVRTISPYVSESSNKESAIRNATMYPNINVTGNSLRAYGNVVLTEASVSTSDGVKTYRLSSDGGNLFSEGDIIDLTGLINIDSSYVTSWGNSFTYNYYNTDNLSWKFAKPFDLYGIYYMSGTDRVYIARFGNASNTLSLQITSSMSELDTLKLYLDWRPANIAVKFYQNQEGGASDNDSARFDYSEYLEPGYYTLNIPFGSRLSSTSTDLSASDVSSHKYYIYDENYGSHAKDMGNLIRNNGYAKLDYWSDAKGLLAHVGNSVFTIGSNTYSNPIAGDVCLYPVFKNAYHINFLSGDNNNILSTRIVGMEEFTDANNNGRYDAGESFVDANDNGKYDEGSVDQFVSEGEEFLVREPLYDYRNNITVIKSTTSSSIFDKDIAGQTIPRSYALNDIDNFEWNNKPTQGEVYVRVYFNLSLLAYRPNTSSNDVTAVTNNNGNITDVLEIGVNYYPNKIFTNESNVGFFKSTPDWSDEYGSSRFAGWYLSNIDGYYNSNVAYEMGNYYKNDNIASPIDYSIRLDDVSSIKSFALRQDGDVVKLYISYLNSQEDTVIAITNGMILYAKIVNRVTVSITNNATLSLSDEGVSKYYDIISKNNYSCTFETVYMSEFAPEFTLNLPDGYGLHSMNVYGASLENTGVSSNIYDELFNDGNLSNHMEDLCSSASPKMQFKYNYNRLANSSNIDTYSGTRVDGTISFSRIAGLNDKNIRLLTKYLTYNITYNYDSSKAKLMFGDQELNENTTSKVVLDGVLLNDLDSIITSIDLSYTLAPGQLNISRVPYGVSLPIRCVFNNSNIESKDYSSVNDLSYKYHMAGWSVSGSRISVNYLGDERQRILPNVNNTTGKVGMSIELSAVFKENEINTITIVARYENIAGNANAWTNILDSNISNTTYKISQNGRVYMINLSADYRDLDKTILKADDAESTKTFTTKLNDKYNTRHSYDMGSDDMFNYFYASEMWRFAGNGVVFDSTGNKLYFKHLADISVTMDICEAYVVKFDHSTVDYDNTALNLEVDRANVTGISYTPTDNTYTKCLVFDQNGIKVDDVTFEKEAIYVKAPVTTSVTAFYTMQEDSSVHGNYYINGYNTNGGLKTIQLVENPDDNTNACLIATSVDVNEFSTNMPNKVVTALVVATGYQVELKNSDSSSIATIKIAYDLEIANKFKTRNEAISEKYLCTLTSLRKSGSIPVFALDSYATVGNTFVSSEDRNVETKAYGNLSQIFSHWSASIGGERYSETQRVDATTLYAVYNTSTEVIIIFADYVDGSVQNVDLRYRVMSNAFTDQFGNIYSNRLSSIYGIVSADVAEVNPYISKTDTNIYRVTEMTDNLIKKTTDNDTAQYGQRYTIAFDYTLIVSLKGDNVYTNSNIKSIGGALTFDKVVGNSNLTIIGGEKSSIVLSPANLANRTFAIWNIEGMGYVSTREGDYSISIANITDVVITAVFNPDVTVNLEASNRGEIYEGQTQLTQSKTYKLLSDDSGKLLMESVSSGSVYEYYRIRKTGFSTFSIERFANVNWICVYNFSVQTDLIEKLAIEVQKKTANGTTTIVLTEENSWYEFDYKSSSISITPIVSVGKIAVQFASGSAFVVTNINSAGSLQVSTKYISGFEIITRSIEDACSVYYENGSNYIGLYFINDKNEKIYIAKVSVKDIASAPLSNLRFQRQTNGMWADICGENSEVGCAISENGKIVIRLVCEYNSMDLYFVTNSADSDAKITLSKSTSYAELNSTKTSATINVLEGGSISVVGNTISIIGIGRDTIVVSVETRGKLLGFAVKNSGEGYIEYTGVPAFSISNMGSTLEERTIILWTESMTNIFVSAGDRNTSDFRLGYGDVQLTYTSAFDKAVGKTPTSYNASSITRDSNHRYLFIVDNSPASTLSVPSSSVITISAGNANGHEYNGARYNSTEISSERNEFTLQNVTASQVRDGKIEVFFNASKSLHKIRVNEKISNATIFDNIDIYGGDEYSFSVNIDEDGAYVQFALSITSYLNGNSISYDTTINPMYLKNGIVEKLIDLDTESTITSGYSYTALGNSDIAIYVTEDIRKIKFNIEVVDKEGNSQDSDMVQVVDSQGKALDRNFLYISREKNEIFNIYWTTIKPRLGGIAIGKGEITGGNLDNFVFAIKPSGDATLVKITSSMDSVMEFSSNSGDLDSKGLIDVDTIKEIKLIVCVEPKTTAKVSLVVSLPLQSDLEVLSVSSPKGYNSDSIEKSGDFYKTTNTTEFNIGSNIFMRYRSNGEYWICVDNSNSKIVSFANPDDYSSEYRFIGVYITSSNGNAEYVAKDTVSTKGSGIHLIPQYDLWCYSDRDSGQELANVIYNDKLNEYDIDTSNTYNIVTDTRITLVFERVIKSIRVYSDMCSNITENNRDTIVSQIKASDETNKKAVFDYLKVNNSGAQYSIPSGLFTIGNETETNENNVYLSGNRANEPIQDMEFTILKDTFALTGAIKIYFVKPNQNYVSDSFRDRSQGASIGSNGSLYKFVSKNGLGYNVELAGDDDWIIGEIPSNQVKPIKYAIPVTFRDSVEDGNGIVLQKTFSHLTLILSDFYTRKANDNKVSTTYYYTWSASNIAYNGLYHIAENSCVFTHGIKDSSKGAARISQWNVTYSNGETKTYSATASNIDLLEKCEKDKITSVTVVPVWDEQNLYTVSMSKQFIKYTGYNQIGDPLYSYDSPTEQGALQNLMGVADASVVDGKDFELIFSGLSQTELVYASGFINYKKSVYSFTYVDKNGDTYVLWKLIVANKTDNKTYDYQVINLLDDLGNISEPSTNKSIVKNNILDLKLTGIRANYTITPVLVKRGRTVTYVANSIMSSDTASGFAMKQSYKNINDKITTQMTFSNALCCFGNLNLLARYDLFRSGYEDMNDYFRIKNNDVVDNHSNYVWLDIQHNQCSLYNDIAANRCTGKEKCNYCEYSKDITIHDWKVVGYEKIYSFIFFVNYEQHNVIEKCSKCNLQRTEIESHSYIKYAASCDSKPYQSCTKCKVKQETGEKLGHMSPEDSQKAYIGAGKLAIYQMCRIVPTCYSKGQYICYRCNKTIADNNYKDHNFSKFVMFRDIANRSRTDLTILECGSYGYMCSNAKCERVNDKFGKVNNVNFTSKYAYNEAYAHKSVINNVIMKTLYSTAMSWGSIMIAPDPHNCLTAFEWSYTYCSGCSYEEYTYEEKFPFYNLFGLKKGDMNHSKSFWGGVYDKTLGWVFNDDDSRHKCGNELITKTDGWHILEKYDCQVEVNRNGYDYYSKDDSDWWKYDGNEIYMLKYRDKNTHFLSKDIAPTFTINGSLYRCNTYGDSTAILSDGEFYAFLRGDIYSITRKEYYFKGNYSYKLNSKGFSSSKVGEILIL